VDQNGNSVVNGSSVQITRGIFIPSVHLVLNRGMIQRHNPNTTHSCPVQWKSFTACV